MRRLPPRFTRTDTLRPYTTRFRAETEKIAMAFEAQFGERAYETQPAGASEDFSIFGRAWKVPYVFWFVGGTDAQTYLKAKAAKQVNAIPSNHSPKIGRAHV